MNELMRESLSALLDGEADELELRRLLQQGDGEELRQRWRRYHLARDAVAGHQIAYPELDISRQVMAAVGRGERDAAMRGSTRLRQRLLRPLGSFAIAASVAATVVIGGQQLAQLGGDVDYRSEPRTAASASPVGLVNSLGATTVQASYGTQALPELQPANRTAYQELARQRMARYMQQHAEQAALNTPQGLIPFARVPRIEE